MVKAKPYGVDIADLHAEKDIIYLQNKDRGSAIKEWRQALKIDPKNSRAKNLMASFK